MRSAAVSRRLSLSLLTTRVMAWETRRVIEVVMVHNPLLRAYRLVTDLHRPRAG